MLRQVASQGLREAVCLASSHWNRRGSCAIACSLSSKQPGESRTRVVNRLCPIPYPFKVATKTENACLFPESASSSKADIATRVGCARLNGSPKFVSERNRYTQTVRINMLSF